MVERIAEFNVLWWDGHYVVDYNIPDGFAGGSGVPQTKEQVIGEILSHLGSYNEKIRIGSVLGMYDRCMDKTPVREEVMNGIVACVKRGHSGLEFIE